MAGGRLETHGSREMTSAKSPTLDELSALPNLLCSVIADPDGSLAEHVGKSVERQERPSGAPAARNVETTVLSDSKISCGALKQRVSAFLDTIGGPDAYDDVLVIPPDFTRFPSHSGIITEMIAEYYGQIPAAGATESGADAAAGRSLPSRFQILPALGTHAPMTSTEIRKMFGSRLADKHEQQLNRPSTDLLFVVHDWRNSVETIGTVDAELVTEATHGMVQGQEWPAQLNTLAWSKRNALLRDTANDGTSNPLDGSTKIPNLILSVGQVVPHEVLGMANYNKNLFVGVGGTEAINLSHFIGAVHGMERLMGRGQNPLRHILNVASQQFLKSPQEIHLWYILTVIGAADSDTDSQGDSGDDAGTFVPAQQPPDVALRGLFIGNDITCYNMACDASLQLNFILLPREPKRIVVYLDPTEFHSTWLGNKAIYRTRMAIADEGQLIILAPGVCKFGEDERIDQLIRKYGYVGTKRILDYMKEEDERLKQTDTDDSSSLRNNLSAIAHLIHGSTEGRFSVTYCPGHLTKAEVEGVGFQYGDVHALMKHRYDVTKISAGWNTDTDGEEFYFIKNPALGLWAVPSRFDQ